MQVMNYARMVIMKAAEARTRLEVFHTPRLEVVVAQGSQEAHKLSTWLL